MVTITALSHNSRSALADAQDGNGARTLHAGHRWPLRPVLDIVLSPQFASAEPFGAVDPGGNGLKSGRVGLERDDCGRLIVRLGIAGRGPFTFLIDSVAPATMLSTSVALRVGLELAGGTLVSWFTRKRSARTAVIPRLDVGSLVVTDVPVIIGDLGSLAGVLALDFLLRFESTFNLDQGWMELAPTGTAGASPTEDGKPPLLLLDGLVSAVPTAVLVDTGAESSLINTALAKALDSEDAGQRPASATSRRAILGTLLEGQRRLNLQIEGYHLTDLTVLHNDDAKFELLRKPGEPALILGLDALSAFHMLRIGHPPVAGRGADPKPIEPASQGFAAP